MIGSSPREDLRASVMCASDPLVLIYFIIEDIHNGACVVLKENCAVPAEHLGESVADQCHWGIVGQATCDDDLVARCGIRVDVWDDRPTQSLGSDATVVDENCVDGKRLAFDFGAGQILIFIRCAITWERDGEFDM